MIGINAKFNTWKESEQAYFAQNEAFLYDYNISATTKEGEEEDSDNRYVLSA